METGPLQLRHHRDRHGPVGREEVEEAIRTLLAWVGEDTTREGLADTPRRVADAFLEYCSGYQQDPRALLKSTFEEVNGYRDMVVLQDIAFQSTCEHHLAPIAGHAHIAYLPVDRVVGISKLARLVECFARRLQIQERMTVDITETIFEVLKPKGAACVIEATHACMKCRGIRKDGLMMTRHMVGAFETDRILRDEFMRQIHA